MSVGDLMNVGPAAGDEMNYGDESEKCSADVNRGLDDVGPNDCGEATFEGINQCQRGNDGDGCDLASSQRDRNHN